MANNRYALEMQEVKELLKDEVELYSQHLMYVYMFIVAYLQTYHLKTLGESGRGGSFACFWEWGAKKEALRQKII